VRPGLDLIAGVRCWHRRAAQRNRRAERLDMGRNLMNALAAVCEEINPAAVLIDSGPGDAPLLDALLQVSRYLVVPTPRRRCITQRRGAVGTAFLRAQKLGRSNYSESCSSTSTPCHVPQRAGTRRPGRAARGIGSHLFPHDDPQ